MYYSVPQPSPVVMTGLFDVGKDPSGVSEEALYRMPSRLV